MSKMFVHYSGTVASFKEAKKDGKSFEEFYNSHVVFIKGGTDGNGAAIYTHGEYFGDVKDALAALQTKLNELKYFSKISDGTNIAEVSVNNGGTISIKGEDPAVTTKIDPTGIKIGLSDAFKKAVNEDLPAAAAAAKKAGEDAAAVDAKLGAKDAVAASGTEATAFGRIKNLETIVAGLTGEEGGEVESVDAKITNAIAKLDVDAKAGDYVTSISQVDGKIEATMGTFAFDAEGSAAQALQDAKDYADGKFQIAGNYEEAGAAAAVQGNLDTEVLRAKAAEEANAAAIKAEKARMDAFMLSAEVGEAAVDTLKEIQSYITSDGTAAAKMAEDITTAQAAADKAQGEVDALEGVVAGVKATAEAAATKDALQAEILRADAAEKANAASIKAISDDYLKASDKTALEGQISAEATTARAAEKANADAIKAISDDYLKGADKTELQGNIDAKVAQSDYDTKVAELASFWEWEEI